MRKEIDMAPYEQYFTELERLFFERNAAMNVVAYMADRQFNDNQYAKVYNHYVECFKIYESFLKEFENIVLKPLAQQPFNWEADFERRVVYVTQL